LGSVGIAWHQTDDPNKVRRLFVMYCVLWTSALQIVSKFITEREQVRASHIKSVNLCEVNTSSRLPDSKKYKPVTKGTLIECHLFLSVLQNKQTCW